MPKPRLVLVHGRAQQRKDPAALEETWLDTLRNGLGDDASVLDGIEVDFPYYGDQLDDFVSQMGAAVPADVRTRGHISQIDSDFLQFQFEVFEEVRRQENITDEQVAAQMDGDVRERGPLNWRWVQAIMRTLDRIPGLGGDMIERFTRDAWIYLTRSKVRQAINDTVRASFKEGDELVVIAHSLGSVVAYDILRQSPAIKVRLLLTVGSPLGVGAVRKRLTPLLHPPGVGSWYNAYDRRDSVALYPLDNTHFPITPPVTNNSSVRNRTENAHGITGYLNDARVAEKVYNALI